MKISVLILIIGLVFIGCTSKSIVMPMENGVYSISKSAPTGFTPLSVIKNDAFEEVNQRAKQEDKVVEIISVNEVPAGFGRWPQVEIRFKLLTKEESKRNNTNQKEIKTSYVYDAKGNNTDSKVSISVDNKLDTYKKLEQLGKLKEQGVLTQTEFENEKKKLLGQ
ncbi:SHOCT domain-containing protein [bacterium]|nr:SHOCT domain-containing protein [bacterium]MBU1435532.1 SHOCT domain-containing protein [bacterium]MBU1502544.1 SHOCT domain-containing protein [bacterium]